MTTKKTYSARALASDGILSVLLLITGMFKIPSFLPGAEFQISAPFAVTIAKNLGFKRYLMIGIASSLCGFVLGVQNILNITVAMIYRITAGAILTLFYVILTWGVSQAGLTSLVSKGLTAVSLINLFTLILPTVMNVVIGWKDADYAHLTKEE